MRNPSRSSSSRRSIRLRGFDYRQAGAYFVTLCTDRKTKLFGTINDGEMELSDLGNVVTEEWRHMAIARRNVQLDLYVAMPNHLHGVMIIDGIQDRDSFQCPPATHLKQSGTLQAGSLGAIIGQFKTAVSRRAKSR